MCAVANLPILFEMLLVSLFLLESSIVIFPCKNWHWELMQKPQVSDWDMKILQVGSLIFIFLKKNKYQIVRILPSLEW